MSASFMRSTFFMVYLQVQRVEIEECDETSGPEREIQSECHNDWRISALRRKRAQMLFAPNSLARPQWQKVCVTRGRNGPEGQCLRPTRQKQNVDSEVAIGGEKPNPERRWIRGQIGVGIIQHQGVGTSLHRSNCEGLWSAPFTPFARRRDDECFSVEFDERFGKRRFPGPISASNDNHAGLARFTSTHIRPLWFRH